MGKTILLLEPESLQALPVARSLKKNGHSVLAAANRKNDYGVKSKFIDRIVLIKEEPKDEGYCARILRIIAIEKVDVLISLSDDSAEVVSKNRDSFTGKVAFTAPEYDSFCQGYDKNQLMALCAKFAYPHPLTYDLSKTELQSLEKENLPFPMLIKPNITTGGRGMILVNSFEELCKEYPHVYSHYGDCHLQEFIPAGGGQLKIQLYVDEKGELIAHSAIQKHRWYPEKGGSCSCGESVNEKVMTNVCYTILRQLGWVGFADFDLIGDPRTGEWKIMEINPRLPACIRVSFIAGVDWAEVIINGALGKPQKNYSHKSGILLRHLGFELLWFFYSKQRFNTKPSWFNFFGHNIYFEDFMIDDLKPFMYGSYNNVKKQLSPEFRRSKSGTRK